MTWLVNQNIYLKPDTNLTQQDLLPAYSGAMSLSQKILYEVVTNPNWCHVLPLFTIKENTSWTRKYGLGDWAKR